MNNHTYSLFACIRWRWTMCCTQFVWHLKIVCTHASVTFGAMVKDEFQMIIQRQRMAPNWFLLCSPHCSAISLFHENERIHSYVKQIVCGTFCIQFHHDGFTLPLGKWTMHFLGSENVPVACQCTHSIRFPCAMTTISNCLRIWLGIQHDSNAKRRKSLLFASQVQSKMGTSGRVSLKSCGCLLFRFRKFTTTNQ